MNLHTLLQQRAAGGNPIRIGVIGAGKFSSMFLSQARLTAGMQIVGVAELDAQKAIAACIKTGWPPELLQEANTAGGINDAGERRKVAITEDSLALIAADLDVVVEITGVPEAGAVHAYKSLECGKHVVMVNVEADCLLGAALKKKADQNARASSTVAASSRAICSSNVAA